MFKKYFVFLTSIFLLGCSAAPQESLIIGTNSWPGYECLHLARDLGYYEKEPIKIVRYPSSTEVMFAWRKGEINGAALTMDEVFLLKELGFHPEVTLIMDFSNGGDVILSREGLKEMSDLKGKRVGAEATALGAYMLSRALGEAGMGIHEITLMHMPVSEHEEAFEQGLVDAVVTFEPTRSRLLKAGAGVLFDSSQLPGEIVDVLAVNRDALKIGDTILACLLKGWFQAVDYLKKNPEEAARFLASREGLTPEQFLSSLQGLHILDLRENQAIFGEEKSSFQKKMNRLSVVMLENGLLKSPIEVFKILADGLAFEGPM